MGAVLKCLGSFTLGSQLSSVIIDAESTQAVVKALGGERLVPYNDPVAKVDCEQRLLIKFLILLTGIHGEEINIHIQKSVDADGNLLTGILESPCGNFIRSARLSRVTIERDGATELLFTLVN